MNSVSPDASLPPPSATVERRPLRLLRHSLDRFARVIELELESAAGHEESLTLLLDAASASASALRRELASASACLHRLRDHLRQLEKLRGVVAAPDLPRFEEAVAPHEQLARERLHRFSALCDLARARAASPPPAAAAEAEEPLQAQAQLSADAAAAETEAEMLAAWEQLAEDVEGLEAMMAEMGRQVAAQGGAVDSIAGSVDSSRTRVLASVRHLAAASRLRYAVAPIAGATIGSLVAGPVGFFVGAKMGAAAGLLGGGVVGLAGGGLAGKMHRRRTDVEMEEMEKRVAEDDSGASRSESDATATSE